MQIHTLLKSSKIPSLCIVVSMVLYYLFAFHLKRTDYLTLLGLYSLLFMCFSQLIHIKHFKLLIGVGIIFRLIFLFTTPNLSQDFYRFIWDGRMILEGFNPYLYTPESFLTNNELPVNQAEELYAGMGTLNGSHFTNYPPINQLCFIIAGIFAGNSILGSAIILRVIIVLADIGILYFGSKLLAHLKLPKTRIFWYFLNPFIIIELTGNLHFEAVMLFFLIWSLYLLQQGKWQLSAVIFALSVSTKLIPLLFLPLFWQWFTKRATKTSQVFISTSLNDRISEKKKPLDSARGDKYTSLGITKLLLFYAIVGITIVITFLPFFNSQFITNYSATVALWFNNFEFNASIYYIAREIGYLFRGYNEIAIIGKILSITVLLFVIGVSFLRQNKTMPQLISAMLICFAFYLFFSTTVHPWYVSTLVILSIFTNYRFPLMWSFVIILSYLSYLQIGNMDKSENLWIISIEYIIVLFFLLKDLFRLKTNIDV